MKKIIFLSLALLFASGLLNAQLTTVVAGQIDNPVANQKVWIEFHYNQNCRVVDSTLTDAQGKYTYTLNIKAGCLGSTNPVRVNILNCVGNSVQTQNYITSSTQDSVIINPRFCDTCTVRANITDTVVGKAIRLTARYSQGKPLAYKWYFGDPNNTTSTQESNTIIYPAENAEYTVCLVVTNTNSGCKDSTCGKVYTGSGCSSYRVNFGHLDSSGAVQFYNYSSFTTINYKWYIDNKLEYTSQHPKHNFSAVGSYNVCLSGQDTINGCKDSTCRSFNITTPYCGGIKGTVYGNNSQLIDTARVWLIDMNIDSITNDTILTAIDSTDLLNSTSSYHFNNAPAGSYLVKAALLPTAGQYAAYLPTYYVQETRWNKATLKTVGKTCVTADITLKSGNNPGGSGFISGLVSQGANKVGDPLEKILVLLYNANNDAVAFTYTDINGEYKFSNLAFGSYKVVVEVLGKPSEEYTVTIDANNPSNDKGNFDVNTKDVSLSKTTGIAKLIKGKLSLYPNPATNTVSISFDAPASESTIIYITDMSGKIISTKTAEISNGENQLLIDLKNIESGLYLVSINTSTHRYLGKLSIAK